MNKKGQTSDMTDDKLDANKTADIEEQLGKLPDFLSDDEKAETKPVIKQEPMGVGSLLLFIKIMTNVQKYQSVSNLLTRFIISFLYVLDNITSITNKSYHQVFKILIA